MSNIKPLSEITKPDARQDLFCAIDPETGGRVPRQVRDHYGYVEELALQGSAPKKVKAHFDLARNLFLYSWYVYDFTTPAVGQAHASVEMALRERYKADDLELPSNPSLTKLLKQAINKGWIVDGGFPHLFVKYGYEDDFFIKRRVIDPNGTEFCKLLLGGMPLVRNTIAHGSSMLTSPGQALMPMEICARIIDQLFPATKANVLKQG